MNFNSGHKLLAASTLLITTALAPAILAQNVAGTPWVGSWSAASAQLISNTGNTLGFSEQTFRQVIHTTIGGTSAQLPSHSLTCTSQ
jgi:hypothetical protein